ncbi:MAG: hypothetical protein WCO45_10955 [Pseudanabaena sp. ELA607]|jgi:hypothetical protein
MARKSNGNDQERDLRHKLQDKFQGKLQHIFQSAVDAAQKKVENLAQVYSDQDEEDLPPPKAQKTHRQARQTTAQSHSAPQSEAPKSHPILEPLKEKMAAFDGWAIEVVNEALEQVTEQLSEKVDQAKESTKLKYQDVSRQAEKMTKKTLHQVETTVEKKVQQTVKGVRKAMRNVAERLSD